MSETNSHCGDEAPHSPHSILIKRFDGSQEVRSCPGTSGVVSFIADDHTECNEKLDAAYQKENKLRQLVSDWQANGNSAVDQISERIWHKTALQLLRVLDGIEE